jgi:hypothetical protein
MLFDQQMIPAWKSSLLPLIFMGNQIGPTVDARASKRIEQDTAKHVVSLSCDGRGWELVSEECFEQGKRNS